MNVICKYEQSSLDVVKGINVPKVLQPNLAEQNCLIYAD